MFIVKLSELLGEFQLCQILHVSLLGDTSETVLQPISYLWGWESITYEPILLSFKPFSLSLSITLKTNSLL